MLRPVLFAFCLFVSLLVNAQSPGSFLKVRNPDLRYLEHLIKTKLDSIRERSKLYPLANDSLLYLVSKGHAKYCTQANKSTHHEIEVEKEGPEDRIEYMGGRNYRSAELLGECYVHHQIPRIGKRVKPGEKMELKTYGAVANYILYHWVNDAKTMRQINNRDFLTVGCAVDLNKVNDHLMVVCVLGRPYLQYDFTEYKPLFPHSKFQMYKLAKSFKEVKNVPTQTYPQNLKIATSASVYANYEENFEKIRFQITEKKGNVYLETTDIEEIKEIFSHSKNGLMLEAVSYETFHAGNPDYYTNPSKRNKKGIFSGIPLNPRFSGLLLNAVNEKTQKWRMLMGKVPDIKGHYEWNVWFICNKKISIKKHLDQFCGEALSLFEPLSLVPDMREETYNYQLSVDTSYVEIPFNDNSHKYRLTEDRKNEIQEVLNNNAGDYKSTKVEVIFTSPVLPFNDNMAPKHERWRKQFVDTLRKSIDPSIDVSVSDTLDWDLLYEKIAEEGDDALMKAGKRKVVDLLKEPQYGMRYFEDLWTKLKVYIRVVRYPDALGQLLGDYKEQIYAFNDSTAPDLDQVYRLERLQNTLFQLMDSINADPKIFEDSQRIAFRPELARLLNNHACYEYKYLKDIHEGDKKWLSQLYKKIKYVGIEVENPAPIHQYNMCAFSVNYWKRKRSYDKKFKSKKIKSLFYSLEKDTTLDVSALEKALYIKAADYYEHFTTNAKAQKLKEKMVDGIAKAHGSSKNNDTLLALASTMAHYGRNDLALEILNPIISAGWQNPEAIKLWLMLSFEHAPPNMKDINTSYYRKLMDAIETLGKDEWCDLFVGPCKISFQAFEYEPLRDLYCKECAAKGNYATKQ